MPQAAININPSTINNSGDPPVDIPRTSGLVETEGVSLGESTFEDSKPLLLLSPGDGVSEADTVGLRAGTLVGVDVGAFVGVALGEFVGVGALVGVGVGPVMETVVSVDHVGVPQLLVYLPTLNK